MLEGALENLFGMDIPEDHRAHIGRYTQDVAGWMTKAVVRAMDAVQAFCKSDVGGKHEVKDFVVAGGSKRGWTTWTTAIVDTRVRAIVPCVIDCLNVIKSFHHHYEALGFWSAAIGDYQSLGILNWLDTPENAALEGGSSTR